MAAKMAAKVNFLRWNQNILVSSLKKVSLNIILIIILDMSFYALSGLIFLGWGRQITARMESVFLPSPDSLAALGIEKAQQAVAEARSFLLLLVLSVILLILAVIFLASVLKCIIWAKTTGTKITFKLMSKFLALNLIWMTFWFALIILASFLVKLSSAPAFIITIFMIGAFFTNTLYTLFMKNPMLSSIPEAVSLSIKKIHLFLLPYSIIFALAYILIKLIGIFKLAYSQIYSQIIFAFAIIVYLAFVRYYTSTLVLEAARADKK